jgi:hypothetical protein
MSGTYPPISSVTVATSTKSNGEENGRASPSGLDHVGVGPTFLLVIGLILIIGVVIILVARYFQNKGNSRTEATSSGGHASTREYQG